MATDDQKKQRLIKMYNDVIFGFGKGLYELFGDSAMATTATIGEGMIAEMEHDLGLEIHAENPMDFIAELRRILIDEYGLYKDSWVEYDPPKLKFTCQDCMLWQATEDMLRIGAPPFHCVPMMLTNAALQVRGGAKARFVGLTQDKEKHICTLDFQIMA